MPARLGMEPCRSAPASPAPGRGFAARPRLPIWRRCLRRSVLASGVLGGLGKAGLGGLGDIVVAFPAFVLQLYVLDGDGVGVGIEVGQGLVLGDPAAVDL